jgi:CheY-like chemotaxis protein
MSLSACKILVVEDHANTARHLGAAIGSLGMVARVAATLADVETALAEGTFCGVLLDKQIPAVAGAEPSVAAGDTAQRMVRAKYPQRNEQDHHLVPILVITSAAAQLEAARQAEFISKNFRDGASVYIPKPFDVETIARELRAALDRAGRTDHARCALLRPGPARPSRRPPVASALAAEIGAKAWSDVEITAVNGHTVKIRCGDAIVRRTYGDLGFASGANRDPTDKWRVVLQTCAGRGVFRGNRSGSYASARNAVYVAQSTLKQAFGLPDNPYEGYRKGLGWKAKFRAASELGEDE